MGKQKDGYQAVKPTPKQQKKAKRAAVDHAQALHMVAFLEQRWGARKVTFKCRNCLVEAFESETNGTNGYVTDEELLAASNGKLRPK